MNQIFTLLMIVSLGYSTYSFSQCALPKPENVKVPTFTSCDATITWDPVPGSSYFMVKFKPSNTAIWTEIPDQLNSLTYKFSGLSPNTYYDFAVASYCLNGTTTGFKEVHKLLPACPLPINVQVNTDIASGANVHWTSQCGTTTYNVRYKLTTSPDWTIVSQINSTTYTISGLIPLSDYNVSVQSVCGGEFSLWSSRANFTTTSATSLPASPTKPNFLLIVLDDARYDIFQPTGGPSWFQSPSINRIANEGANFSYAFPTTSQCAPSRVSIYTGLYAHHHGALDNKTHMIDNLPLVQQILKDNGYHTGFVGKYGQFQGQPEGFDWWAVSDKDVFINALYTINGAPDTIIPGHITDVYKNLAAEFFNNVPDDKPFALFYFTRVPHIPTLPRIKDMNLYTQELMPFPDNFDKYSEDYPSYFYKTHNWGYNEALTDSLRLIEFQSLAGIEENVKDFFSGMESVGILDSTMIILTSDNGYMKGEHKLEAKQLAQEESIRVPLFIRYPAWFAAGSTYLDKMAANIDIAPTILEAAGIPETFNMDGISLKKLVDGQVQRPYFFYQYAGDYGVPSIRAIRSLEYKYVKHYCNEVTEEFYDLINDPEENINHINDSSYETLISSYRTILDSIRTAEEDYNPIEIDCYLINLEKTAQEDTEHDAANDRLLRLWPIPASDFFLISYNEAGNKENISIQVTNIIGQVIYFKDFINTDVLNTEINCQKWHEGAYIVTLKKGKQSYSEKIIIGR
jgi:N-acetylglucosamine-6-sulfatase